MVTAKCSVHGLFTSRASTVKAAVCMKCAIAKGDEAVDKYEKKRASSPYQKFDIVGADGKPFRQFVWSDWKLETDANAAAEPFRKSVCCGAGVDAAFGKGDLQYELLGMCRQCLRIIVRHVPLTSKTKLLQIVPAENRVEEVSALV